MRIAANEEKRNRQNGYRFPFIRSASIHSRVEQSALCRDISPYGIGMLHCHEIEIGKPTDVSIVLNDIPIKISVVFLWTRDTGNGWWISGGKFKTSVFLYPSLLLATVRNVFERRRRKRYSFFQPLMVKAMHGSSCAEHDVCGIDLSYTGMSFISKEVIYEEELLVQTRKKDEFIRATVVRYEESKGGFGIYGAKFDYNHANVPRMRSAIDGEDPLDPMNIH